jgi:hypothetical protein
MPTENEIKSKYTLDDLITMSKSELSNMGISDYDASVLNAFLCVSLEIKELKEEIKQLKDQSKDNDPSHVDQGQYDNLCNGCNNRHKEHVNRTRCNRHVFNNGGIKLKAMQWCKYSNIK